MTGQSEGKGTAGPGRLPALEPQRAARAVRLWDGPTGRPAGVRDTVILHMGAEFPWAGGCR